MENANGATKLATALQKRMSSVYQHDSKVFLELGKITSSMGLKLDNFSHTIPSGDYMICKSLKLPTVKTSSVDGHSHSTDSGQSGSAGSHSHTVDLGQNTLYPGCRVLVGWAGGEPVVIDVVVR